MSNRIEKFFGEGHDVLSHEASGYPLVCDRPLKKPRIPAAGIVYGSPEQAAEQLRNRLRIEILEHRVESLANEVKRLKAGREEPDTAARVADGDPCISDVIRITQDMFPGQPTVEVDCDPEDPANSFVVFNVKCTGSAKEIVDKRLEWHDRVSKIQPGSSGNLRLSIIPI